MKKTFTKVASFLFVAILAMGTSTAVAQSECASALPIACGDPNVFGDTTGDTPGAGIACVTSDAGAPAHWYAYTETGAGSVVTINTCLAGTAYDTKLHVWDGTLGCASLSCITGNDDVTCTPSFRSEVTFCTLPGGIYYIQVSGFSTNAGVYEMSIACAAAVIGCSDPVACNFDPLATCDSGTCDFISCAGCTDPGACNFDPLATLDDGSCDYSCVGCSDPLACNYGGVLVTIDDGSCCLLNCVTVNMYDSFGDGWNGASYVITDDAGNLIASGGLGAGSFGADVLCLADACYFISVGGGTFDSEITWDLLGADAGDIIGGIAPSGSINFTLGGAPCLGCTDPLACNFLATADTDDGSCCLDNCVTIAVGGGAFLSEVSWNLLDGGGVVVESGFAPENIETCLASGCYTVEYFDSFGDGWNGVTFEIFDDGGVLQFSGTLADGTDGTEDFGLFAISGCTNILASNFDPLAVCDDGTCAFCDPGEQTLTMNMTDTFGDGWNGAQYYITDEFGNLVAFGSVDLADAGDGATTGQDVICLSDGCYAIEITAGTFPGEIGWDLQDQLGNSIFSAVAPFGAPFGPLGFLLGAAACDVPGCTDTVCLNFNPYATIDDGSCVCPPDNNDCVDAVPLFCGGSFIGTTINSNDNEGLIGTACDAANTIDGPGVWYVVNGDGQQWYLSTCATVSGYDTKMSVYEGPCGALTCLGGNDDSPNCTGFLSEFNFAATAGTDYYILIHGFGGATGDFVLDVICTDCTGLAPSNDLCDDALLVANGVTFVGSTCCNGADVPDGCTPAFATPYGAWFVMNSGLGACSFDIELNNISGGAVGVSIFEDIGNLGCTNLNTIACCGPITGTCAGDLSGFYTLIDNTDYYFFVYTTDPINCGEWDFTVTLGICGCTDPLADNYNPLANIDDGTCTYTTVAPGDLICDALALPCGTIDMGGTLGGATATDAPLVAGCNAAAGAGVWYTFVGDGSFHLIETCGSVADTQIDIFTSADGTCTGTLTCIATEVDDNQAGAGCGFFEADDTFVEFIDDGSSTYFVYVSATDGILTGFEITNECSPVVSGCTDSCAVNYDPAANLDDGSCDFFTGLCAACPGGVGFGLNMDMTDAFGDGWNGATYEISDALGNVIASGSIDAAQCFVDIDNFAGPETGDDYFCICDPGCYSITVGGGSWDSEISWNLLDDVGGSVASGGAPTTVLFTLGVGIVCGCTDGLTPACNFDPLATNDDGSCEYDSCAGCLDPAACNWDPGAILSDGSCCYDTCVEFNMFDSFGDGWNGATYDVYEAAGGTLVATGDLDNAQSGDGLNIGVDVLCLTDGCYYIEVGGGAFDGEITWVFLGVNGVVTGGATTAPVYFSVGTGICVSCQEPLACNYDPTPPNADCTLCDYTSCLGCTYIEASNYDPLATIDDGSCILVLEDTCPFDSDDNNQIDTLDLLAFLSVFGTTCP